MAKAQITLPLEIPDVRVLKSEINPAGEVMPTPIPAAFLTFLLIRERFTCNA
ncbi:MAG TPA: hypothetical protein VHP83_17225 [Aggregatilineaceae bacterium]|nr:hypothetical protein [Aggregatilineaceae bacterium]